MSYFPFLIVIGIALYGVGVCALMLIFGTRYREINEPWEEALANHDWKACDYWHQRAKAFNAASELRLRAFNPVYVWKLFHIDWTKPTGFGNGRKTSISCG
jgi:hypothetical protein